MNILLWRTDQQSRRFQEFLGELRVRWQDNAAYHIFRRYLNPHQEENAKMLQAFIVQDQELEQAAEQRQEAIAQRLLADIASQSVNMHLDAMRATMHEAENFYAYSITYERRAFTQIPSIDELIQQAELVAG